MTILTRHLAGQSLGAALAVTLLLLLVVVAGRFSGYLGDVIQGLMSGPAVWIVLLMRVPEFLGLLVPLGLYIGMALVGARMVGDSELVAWRAAGASPGGWLRWALATAAGPTLAVAGCVLWLAPWCAQNLNVVLLNRGALNEFDVVKPGRFIISRNGSRMAWAAADGRDSASRRDVLVVEQDRRARHQPGVSQTTIAQTATQVVDPDSGSSFLVLHDGYRYEGVAGTSRFRVAKFDRLGWHLPDRALKVQVDPGARKSSGDLLRSTAAADRAEGFWRIGQILLVPFAALLVPLVTPVSPRNGRNFSIGLGLGLYLGVFVVFMGLRGALASGVPGATAGWFVILSLPLLAALAVARREQRPSWPWRR